MTEITDINGTFKLNNGVLMPYFGLGVFKSAKGQETIQAIHWALESEYRHIDTAFIYQNEDSVGEAVKTSGLKREEIFITTKVWNSDQGFQQTLDALQRSLDILQMDYIDLYLIHWPGKNKYIGTWEALEELYNRKLVRAIGVSNFLKHHLETLLNRNGKVPMVNQVEFHPHLQQQNLVNFCKQHNIQYEAWSPIMKGEVNRIPELIEIAKKYGKSPVQVILRWDLQKGIITIPKSVHKERIISNAELFDFELSDDDISRIDILDRNERIGPDPDIFGS
jgi:diketogulonate reductase-like aldo/keto reductase